MLSRELIMKKSNYLKAEESCPFQHYYPKTKLCLNIEQLAIGPVQGIQVQKPTYQEYKNGSEYDMDGSSRMRIRH
jgi:hypothetical protein